MQLQNPQASALCKELDLIRQSVPLDHAVVLELGCGGARMTRLIAEQFPIQRLIATEVDQIQHQKNIASEYPATIEFREGGAQAIELPDNSVDVVFMFKSLHHVPLDLLDQSLQEIARVLKPNGLSWFLEPVYEGAFNDILKLFHDEKIVREAAFQALQKAVEQGHLTLVEQLFCHTDTRFKDFADFEQCIMRVTHTQHQFSDELYQTIKQRFEAHMGIEGVQFANPIRVDILRKPATVSVG